MNDITGNLDARKACTGAMKLHKKYLKKVRDLLLLSIDNIMSYDIYVYSVNTKILNGEHYIRRKNTQIADFSFESMLIPLILAFIFTKGNSNYH